MPVPFLQGANWGARNMNFIVTNCDPDGDGSLRWALERAATEPHSSQIDFALPSPGAIKLRKPLPDIVSRVTLNGSAAGRVTIDGRQAGDCSGLTVRANGAVIRGLEITGFERSGVELVGATNCVVEQNICSGNGLAGVFVHAGEGNRIRGNLLGTDATGETAIRNGIAGIWLVHSARNIIGGAGLGNVVSGNWRGIIVAGSGATANVLYGNKVGSNSSGTRAVPNERTGVLIFRASDTRIGGPGEGEGNLLSGNTRSGLNIDGSTVRIEGLLSAYDKVGIDAEFPTSGFAEGTVVQGNRIGTDITGQHPLPNGLHGILVFEASKVTIGGEARPEANVIAANAKYGILVMTRAEDFMNVSSDNALIGNRIGTDLTGVRNLANKDHGIFLQRTRRSRLMANVIKFNGGFGILGSLDDLDGDMVERQNTVSGNDRPKQIALRRD